MPNGYNTIIETIRMDEIDFGDNLSSVLENTQSTQSTNIQNKKVKEIKVLPIKIGKKKN